MSHGVCAGRSDGTERQPRWGTDAKGSDPAHVEQARGANEVTQLTLGWSDDTVRTVVSDHRTPSFTKLRESRHQALEMRGRAVRGRSSRDPTPTPIQSRRFQLCSATLNQSVSASWRPHTASPRRRRCGRLAGAMQEQRWIRVAASALHERAWVSRCIVDGHRLSDCVDQWCESFLPGRRQPHRGNKP